MVHQGFRRWSEGVSNHVSIRFIWSEYKTHIRCNRKGQLLYNINRILTTILCHIVKKSIHGVLDARTHSINGFTRKYGFNHSPAGSKHISLALEWDNQVYNLCFMWSGLSISTNVGFLFAASFPPWSSSGKPGRLRCFERRWSVRTLQISLCFTTSHAWLPSQSSTLETGSLARSMAYSSGGSAPREREKGNFGVTINPKIVIRAIW